MKLILFLSYAAIAIFFLGYTILGEADSIGRHANPPAFRRLDFYWECLASITWPISLPLAFGVRKFRRYKNRQLRERLRANLPPRNGEE